MEKTDYKITEFHNSEFGSIRMIEDCGRLLFSGIDVAFALGYAKPRNAINVHCKGALKRGVLTPGGVQPMIFIPEAGMNEHLSKPLDEKKLMNTIWKYTIGKNSNSKE